MQVGPSSILLLLLAMGPAIAQVSQETNTQSAPLSSTTVQQEPSVQPEEDSSSGQRIVDPSQYPPKPSWPSRVLLSPFRALGPGLERHLTHLEQQRRGDVLRRAFENPYARPRLGGLGDGSGFGVGTDLSSGNLISSDFKLVAALHATSNRYFFGSVGLQAQHRSRSVVWGLNLAPRYQLRPQEDFWGTGPQSLRSDRTNYDLQEREVGLTFSASLPRGFRLGTGVDYSSNSIFAGKDSRFPSTQTVFGASGLPGLSQGATLFGPFVFGELEARNSIGNPTSGGYLRFVAASYDSAGKDDFGFWNFLLDARGYLPLGTERRVLAVRMIGDFNEPKGGSQVPFFRLARLGDSHTLRGYDTYRFHARNAMAWNLEYHWRLTGGMAAFGFTDWGQVFDDFSQFKIDNMRVTGGGGLQFNTSKAVILKIFIGQSDEGTRFFFNFGPTF